MTACTDQLPLLGAFVDGELDSAERALVEAHVATCGGCRSELLRLRALHHLLSSSGARHRAPAALARRVGGLSRPGRGPSND